MARQSKTNRRAGATRTAAAGPRRKPWNIPPKYLDSLIVAVLLLLTAVAYVQVLGFEFTNYDDPAYIPENAHVRDGFSLGGIRWACTTFETANWYPLTWLSLMLDCQLFGPRPGVIQAVNALLHAANAVLLFAALKRMTGRRWPSAAVAALFAVHPLHVESVAWVAERKDVLSTLFFMLALIAYQSYAARGGLGRWVLVFLAMFMGLLSKPMLVTLPFLLLLLDYWPVRRQERESGRVGDGETTMSTSSPPLPLTPSPTLFKTLLLEKLPLLALSAAAAAVTMAAQASQGATKMLGDVTPLPLRAANAAIAYVKYLGMTFWPVNLAVFYPYEFHPTPVLVVVAIVLLAGVSVAVIWLRRHTPYLAVGWFWYLGMLVPTIGVVQVGAQGLADRYTYIPSIGIFLVVAWGMADLVASRSGMHRFVASLSSLILAALSVMTYLQVSYWATSEQLFGHAITVTGDNAVSCENLGDALLHREHFAEAEVQFRKVLALDPVHFRQTPGELARSLAGQKRVADAIALLHETPAEDMDRAKAMNDLALFVAPRGYVREAIELLKQVIELAPQQPAGYKNLAWIYGTCPAHNFRNGPKAVELARQACELSKWSDVQALLTLADAYIETGDREQAIEQLRAALKLSPKDAAIKKKLDDELKGRQ